MKKSLILLIYSFGFFCPEYIQSQLLYNNGAPIYISTGAIVCSRGAVNNENSGSIQNFGNLTIDSTFTNDANASGDGTWFVSGNWINNFIFLAGSGSVFLEGNNQTIEGTSTTTFYNLTLQGSGIKSLNQNINILNIIALNDRELNLDNFTLFIENSNLSAITRTSGFISNNLFGRLIRRTNTASNYLFPMGSSIGIPRYRPVEITPENTITNKYSAGMINHNAGIDGFNLNQTDTNICNLNNLYYHHVNRDSGSTYARITFYYDSLADGNQTIVANWQNSPPAKWYKVDSTNFVNGSPFSLVNVNHWLFNGSSAFVLGNSSNLIELGSNVTGCTGDTILLDATNQFTTYLWSTGSTLQTINVTASGIYYVTVTANNCTSSDSVSVTLAPIPLANAGQDVSVCQGNSVQLIASGGTSYNWLVTNGLSNPNIYNPLATPVNTTSYIVDVSDGQCHNTDTVLVTVVTLPAANAGQDVSVCQGNSVQLIASGGTSYNWLVTNGLSNPNIYNPLATPVNTTSYIVDVSNGQCHNTDTVVVTVLPLPFVNAGADTTINEETPYQFSPVVSAYTTAIWTPSAGLSNANIINPTAIINSTTTYILTIYDDNGCTGSDAITLTIIPKHFTGIVIHNTFTPNGDGVNDTWFIENLSQYPDNHLSIYNRNGHVVYEKQGYNNDWDGKYFGNNLPESTYYYVLTITGMDTFKGDITIIR